MNAQLVILLGAIFTRDQFEGYVFDTNQFFSYNLFVVISSEGKIICNLLYVYIYLTFFFNCLFNNFVQKLFRKSKQ